MTMPAEAGEVRKPIPLCEPSIGDHELELVASCLRSGWVSAAGPYVPEFESRFAERVGARHAAACGSGTGALHLALQVLGIGPGDEVIVPALTFIATANAVTYVGAKPVFADVTPDTWTLDPDELPRQTSARTRAIIPVHLYGHPADMDPVLEWARDRGMWVVEDATEALGARYRGRQAGVLGHIGCFSFNGNKLITTGSGGMAVTDNAEWGERLRSLASQARAPGREYRHTEIGYNYRLTNVQAALGLAQLDRLQEILQAKRAHEERYRNQLGGLAAIQLWPSASWADPDHWMLGVLLREGRRESRARLIDALEADGITTRPFFMPLHFQPPYQSDSPKRLPVATSLWERGLLLPSSTSLTDAEIDRVCSVLARTLA